MGLALVLLLNAILQIRPAEFVPGLSAVPLYEITLALCLLTCAPRLLAELSPSRVAATPIVGCLLVFAGISLLSNLARGDIDRLAETTTELLRIVLYVGLLVAVLQTPARLRLFLSTCAFCAATVTVLAILNYQGILALPGYVVVQEETGRRLGASGLYSDPNDLALLITQGMILSAYGLTDRSSPTLARLLHLVMLAALGLGLQLTQSRGGLLGLVAGVVAVLTTRYRGKGLLIAGIAVPLVLAAFAGRQADFGSAVGSGSGQARIHLWDDYLALAIQNPVLGIGAGAWKDYERQVAHNSFLHAFAETGLPGGVSFLGLAWLGISTMTSFGPRRAAILDPRLRQLQPYLLAMIGSYLVGMLSLTRVYTLPTYTMLASIVAFSRVTLAEPAPATARLDARFWSNTTVLGVAFLALVWIYIRKNASYY